MFEKFFVGRNLEAPEQIFFDEIDAFISGYIYIDSFDEGGYKVNSYKFVNDEYVTNF